MKKILVIFITLITVLFISLLMLNNNYDVPVEEPPVQVLEEYNFIFNNYALLENDIKYLGESHEIYKEIVDSILKGEEKKQVENILEYQKIFNILNIRCPFFYLVEDMTYNEKDNTINIIYKNDIDIHLKLINEFKNMVKEIMEYNIKYNDSDIDIAMSLYKYISTSINYDSKSDNSIYYSIMSKKGSDINYASVYQYLLLQANIDSYMIYGTTLALQEHNWLIVKLNDNYYHMDPFFEKNETAGYGLYYFGMNDQRRLESVNNEFNKNIGEWEDSNLKECNSKIFDDFKNKILWSNDRKNNRIELINNNTGTSYFNKIN